MLLLLAHPPRPAQDSRANASGPQTTAEQLRILQVIHRAKRNRYAIPMGYASDMPFPGVSG